MAERLVVRAIGPDGMAADIGPVFSTGAALRLRDECEAAGWMVPEAPVPYMTVAGFREKAREEKGNDC